MSEQKYRPPRVYITPKDKFYIVINDKKIYIDIPKGHKIPSKHIKKHIVDCILGCPKYHVKRPKKKRTLPKKADVVFSKPIGYKPVPSKFGYVNTAYDIPKKKEITLKFEPMNIPKVPVEPTPVGAKGQIIPTAERIYEGKVIPTAERIYEGKVIPTAERIYEGKVIPTAERIYEGKIIPTGTRLYTAEVVPRSEAIKIPLSIDQQTKAREIETAEIATQTEKTQQDELLERAKAIYENLGPKRPKWSELKGDALREYVKKLQLLYPDVKELEGIERKSETVIKNTLREYNKGMGEMFQIPYQNLVGVIDEYIAMFENMNHDIRDMTISYALKKRKMKTTTVPEEVEVKPTEEKPKELTPEQEEAFQRLREIQREEVEEIKDRIKTSIREPNKPMEVMPSLKTPAKSKSQKLAETPSFSASSSLGGVPSTSEMRNLTDVYKIPDVLPIQNIDEFLVRQKRFFRKNYLVNNQIDPLKEYRELLKAGKKFGLDDKQIKEFNKKAQENIQKIEDETVRRFERYQEKQALMEYLDISEEGTPMSSPYTESEYDNTADGYVPSESETSFVGSPVRVAKALREKGVSGITESKEDDTVREEKVAEDITTAPKVRKPPTYVETTPTGVAVYIDENSTSEAEKSGAEESKDQGERSTGAGKYTAWNDGLYDDQIENILQSKTKRFVPVIMSDEIPSLVKYVNPKTKEFGFVINSTSSRTQGQHWRAVFLDFINCEIDYYDSLVSQPTKQFLKDIKLLVDKVNPPCYMKIKVNLVKTQGDDTQNCGFFAAKFLIDRFKNKPFKEASMVDKSDIGEYNIEKFKNYL
jgi:hypothetical protein